MIYEYSCPLCEKTFDIEHPMSEVGNLSEETKSKLRCPGVGKCEQIKEGEEKIAEQVIFTKVFSATFLKFDSLSNVEKQKVLKKRASVDFKKNIEEKKRHLQGAAINQLKNTFGK